MYQASTKSVNNQQYPGTNTAACKLVAAAAATATTTSSPPASNATTGNILSVAATAAPRQAAVAGEATVATLHSTQTSGTTSVKYSTSNLNNLNSISNHNKIESTSDKQQISVNNNCISINSTGGAIHDSFSRQHQQENFRYPVTYNNLQQRQQHHNQQQVYDPDDSISLALNEIGTIINNDFGDLTNTQRVSDNSTVHTTATNDHLATGAINNDKRYNIPCSQGFDIYNQQQQQPTQQLSGPENNIFHLHDSNLTNNNDFIEIKEPIYKNLVNYSPNEPLLNINSNNTGITLAQPTIQQHRFEGGAPINHCAAQPTDILTMTTNNCNNIDRNQHNNDLINNKNHYDNQITYATNTPPATTFQDAQVNHHGNNHLSQVRPKPYVEIVEQPSKCALRFRYKCEGRSAGSLPGINSTAENKTFPSIRIVNHVGRAVVVVSCVTKDAPYRAHPHNIVGKEGCKKGICTIVVNNEANMVRSFPSIGIQCVKRKDIEESLALRESINVDPFRNGFAHKLNTSNIDLNVVRLCFQVFIEGSTPNKCDVPLTPVVSHPIHDKKAMSDLVISRLSHCSAPATGGREVILLCDRIAKEDIQIRFFQERDGKLIWETFTDVAPTDVHKQVAICFKTPKYYDENITHPVMAQVQLKRISDNQVSEPRFFQFLPCESDEDIISRKRQKIEWANMNHYALDNILQPDHNHHRPTHHHNQQQQQHH